MNEIYYKYRNFDNEVRLKQILEEKKMFASDYNKLNDPMDSFFEYEYKSKIDLDDLHNRKFENKILSLSKSSNNILMWTHYSKDHTGIVIGIEIIKNDNDISIYEVEYQKELPLYKEENNKEEFLKEVLTTKLFPWEYEQEIRVLSKDNKIDIKIKEIIFGCKTTEENKNIIYNCFSDEEKKEIKFYDMKLDDLDTLFTFVKV